MVHYKRLDHEEFGLKLRNGCLEKNIIGKFYGKRPENRKIEEEK